MGFFSNPLKAFKGFINKSVPFGRHLTGANADRQKHLYGEAVGRYNTYATEAQRNIDSLSQSLQQSMQELQQLHIY